MGKNDNGFDTSPETVTMVPLGNVTASDCYSEFEGQSHQTEEPSAHQQPRQRQPLLEKKPQPHWSKITPRHGPNLDRGFLAEEVFDGPQWTAGTCRHILSWLALPLSIKGCLELVLQLLHC